MQGTSRMRAGLAGAACAATLAAMATPAQGAPPRIEIPTGRSLAEGAGAVLHVPVRYRADGGRAAVRVRLVGASGATATLRRVQRAPRQRGPHVHRLTVSDADLVHLLGPGRVGRVEARVTVRHRGAAGAGQYAQTATRMAGASIAATAPAGAKIAGLYTPNGLDGGPNPMVFVQWYQGAPYIASVYLDSAARGSTVIGCDQGAVAQPQFGPDGRPDGGFIDPSSLGFSATETASFFHALVGTTTVSFSGGLSFSGQTLTISWTGGSWSPPTMPSVSCVIPPGSPTPLQAVPAG